MSVQQAEHGTETVEALFLGLGRNRNSVARNLEQAKVLGLRHRPSLCPVAIYMAQHGFQGRTDGQYFVTVCPNPRCEPGCEHEVVARVPEAVRGFILDFDRGLYPTLDVHSSSGLVSS